MSKYTSKRIGAPKLKACGIYARNSVPDQVAIMKKVRNCSDRVVELGGQVENVYADNGSSDSTIGPGLRRLLDDARAGRLDCVVVDELDPYARTPATSFLVQEMRALGVEIQSANEARAAPPVFPFESAQPRAGGRRISKARLSGRKRGHRAGASH